MRGNTQPLQTSALPTLEEAVARDLADGAESMSDMDDFECLPDYDDFDSRPDLDDDELWPWDYPVASRNNRRMTS